MTVPWVGGVNAIVGAPPVGPPYGDTHAGAAGTALVNHTATGPAGGWTYTYLDRQYDPAGQSLDTHAELFALPAQSVAIDRPTLGIGSPQHPAWVAPDLTQINHYVEWTVEAIIQQNFFGPAVRISATATDDAYYPEVSDFAGGRVYVRTTADGSRFMNLWVACALGDVIRMEAVGSNLTLRNVTQTLSAGPATMPASGQVGTHCGFLIYGRLPGNAWTGNFEAGTL